MENNAVEALVVLDLFFLLHCNKGSFDLNDNPFHLASCF